METIVCARLGPDGQLLNAYEARFAPGWLQRL